MSRTRTAVVGAVVGALALTGCSVYDAPLPGGPDTGDEPIQVTARFRDVLDLVPQSTVKLDDVDVGKVTGVDLDGYVAEVEMSLRRDVELPGNVAAQIRQTSLLGEKFVSLERPSDPAAQALADGDVIGLDRTGRNPEVEEVFSALALLLNGGGVGQLRSITREVNAALGGRTDEIRSVLSQLEQFIGQLDDNKAAIIAAIENTNRLAKRARDQEATIEAALDDVPGALRSLNGQREDLVRLLEALTRLSDVGTDVIRRSKTATVNSLQSLGPVLEGLADAGDALPKALQVYLTYPFIDEAVGRDPQVARNLHMGDYTNLSVDLDLNLLDLPIPGLPELPGLPEEVCEQLDEVLEQTRTNVGQGIDRAVAALPDNPLISEADREELRATLRERLLDAALDSARENCRAPSVEDIVADAGAALPTLLRTLDILTRAQVRQLLNGTLGTVGDALGGAGGGVLGGEGSGVLPDVTGGLTGGLTGRAAPAYDGDAAQIDPFGLGARGLDPGVGTLLLQGVATNR
ncbi:MCE family protein [Nocardioides aequoreus]|uniref:MCE family protein n=1 Tax=Nocardioides aequoreus TaxID=397278 RepID=UPI000B1A0F5B|nr:MCE family protein [Nocardioides aequoreus]